MCTSFKITVSLLVVGFALVSSASIAEQEFDDFFEQHKNEIPMDRLLERSKREDVIKYLVDSVDKDVDNCGSPLQIHDDQVTISAHSLTCLVQAVVDSINAGPGLLRTLIDNILKKRDLSAVEMSSPLSKSDELCAMKAILKEAINIVREQHGMRRMKRWLHHKKLSSSSQCEKIQSEIDLAMEKHRNSK